MLGKGPCLPRTSSSRSLLIPCEDSDNDTTLCNKPQQVTGPALCSPCKIIIGFEVEPEKKPPVDVCESPRSVLESSAVLSSHDKQQVVARSLRSGLGSLLAAKSTSEEDVGTGLGIVAEASVKSKHHTISSSPSKVVTAWPAKTYDHDPMNYEVFPFQEQGLHVNLQADMEDRLLDADISPLRTTGFCMQLNEDVESVFCKASSPKASVIPGNSVKVDKMAADVSSVPCKVHANPSKDVVDLFSAPSASVHDKESNCTSMDAPEDTIHQSIFSTASPPICSRSLVRSSSGFLKMCNLCGRSLHLGKDVFMYRGDQPFCSAECRYQKIVRDESDERKGG
ncbi:hypothetical protein GOP47_0024646 [Adiantum capillus-veneris]|uniref:FLZ-type domain-containing protein n=1 Tax=Adiantum capillus-veneris TaxID=13818 RepID=A0A9D4U4U4_ADICA|nr:hypothetical protein GOP47_0024646 [Adiantum capillus-veneris]